MVVVGVVITVNYVVADGQSNWLEGMILMCKLSSTLLLQILSDLTTFDQVSTSS